MVCIFVTTNNTSAQNTVRDPERFENTSSSRRCLYERVSVLVSHHKRGVCIVGGNTVVCFGCLCLSSRNTGRFISYFSHRRCQEWFLSSNTFLQSMFRIAFSVRSFLSNRWTGQTRSTQCSTWSRTFVVYRNTCSIYLCSEMRAWVFLVLNTGAHERCSERRTINWWYMLIGKGPTQHGSALTAQAIGVLRSKCLCDKAWNSVAGRYATMLSSSIFSPLNHASN